MKKIAVVGGSGFIGIHVCNQLMAAGYRLTVLTRRRQRVRQDLIVLPTVDVVELDVYPIEALTEVLRGHDALIFLPGILHGRAADFEQAHVALPQRMLQACQQAGVPRYLHMSALPAAADAPSLYLQSKARGEAAVKASALDWTIFRPSVVFGAEDRFTNLFACLLRGLPVLPLAAAEAQLQPVWVGDVARAFVTALQRPEAIGQCYDLGGPRVWTLGDLVATLGEISGHRRAVLPLPGGVARLQAMVLQHLPGRLLSPDNLLSLQRPSICSGDWPALFDWKPSSLEAIAPAYLAGASPRGRYASFRAAAR